MLLDLHVTATAATDWMHDLVIAAIGIVGAVLGAVATGFVTDKAGKEKVRQEQLERDKLAGFSVRYGLLHIYSRAMDNVRLFAAAREASKAPNGDHFGMLLQPLANFPTRVEFPPADIFSLVRIGGVALYNAVASLDLQHNSFIDTLQTFYAMQSELKKLVTSQALANGMVGGSMPLGDYKANEHRFLALDDLFAQMERNANGLYVDTFSALKELVAAEAKHFGQRVEIQVKRLAGDDETILGTPAGKG
jgi:hypothetical protein